MEQAIFNKKNHHFFKNNEANFEFCGFSKNLPSHAFGPAIRNLFILHIVLDGEGTYFVGKKRYDLESGDMFLIRPNESTFYHADKTKPWTYAWIAFSGEVCEQVIAASIFSLEQYTAHTSKINEYVAIIKDCLELQEESLQNELKLTEYLFKFFQVLLVDAGLNIFPKTTELPPLVNQTIEYVAKHFFENLTVASIADSLNVDRSYLSRVFSKTLKYSLKSWILNVKMNYAASQLSVTRKSIEEIAYQIGYNSIDSFSRAYKTFTGESPSHYRKRMSHPQIAQNIDFEVLRQLTSQKIETRAT